VPARASKLKAIILYSVYMRYSFGLFKLKRNTICAFSEITPGEPGEVTRGVYNRDTDVPQIQTNIHVESQVNRFLRKLVAKIGVLL